MNRDVISKIIGIALIASAIILLLLKLESIPNAYNSMEAWLSPDGEPNTIYLILSGILAFEVLLLAGRSLLGYFLFVGKKLNVVAFYTLVSVVAISGISGIVFSLSVVILRHYRGSNGA